MPCFCFTKCNVLILDSPETSILVEVYIWKYGIEEDCRVRTRHFDMVSFGPNVYRDKDERPLL